MTKKKLKVVLAYSGGLDTSIILKWLQTEYDAEVVTFTADLGQGEEVEPARRKAEMLGVRPENIFIEDLREEFVRDFVFPMFRANTRLRRPVSARHVDRAAADRQAADRDRAAGRRRRRLSRRDRQGQRPGPLRARLLCAGARHQGDRAVARVGVRQPRGTCSTSPRSTRSRSPRTSAATRPSRSTRTFCTPRPKGRCSRTRRPRRPNMSTSARSRPRMRRTRRRSITIDFERGDPVAIDGEKLSPATLLTKLNQLGHDNGIGRLDLVENRFVGMKSRGVYETPGGTILLAAHRGIESITLDGGAMHLKDELMPRYASLIYNGFWFAPEREMLQAAIDKSQEHVTGRVTMKLYKGNATVIGRESAQSLYDQDLVTFEEGSGSYDHRDAAGFIRLNALRLRTIAQRERRLKP